MGDLTQSIVQAFQRQDCDKVFNLLDEYIKPLRKAKTSWAKTIINLYDTAVSANAKLAIVKNLFRLIAVYELFTKPAVKWAVKAGQYAVPMWILADLGEYVLKRMGYELEGQALGAAGNTTSGAMIGFSLGGPLGAAVGGILGLVMWKFL